MPSSTDLLIHCFDHSRVNGVTLPESYPPLVVHLPDLLFRPKFPLFGIQQFLPLGLVFGYKVVPALKRSVDRVERQVEQERIASVLVEDFQRCVCQDLRQVRALGIIAEPGIIEGSEIAAARRTDGPATYIDIKALVLGPILLLGAEVPLTEKCRLVAMLLQGLGQGDFLQRHLIIERRRVEPARPLAAEPVGRTGARWILTRHYAEPCRTAYRIGRVAAGKVHAGTRQPVYIRRLVEAVGIIGADIHPSVVIDEEEHEIERLLLRCSGAQQCTGG